MQISATTIEPGGLLGMARDTSMGRAIRIYTLADLLGYPVNHVGLVAEHRDHVGDGSLYCFESTMTMDLPCAIRGVVTRGVQAHPLRIRIGYERRRAGRVWYYPPVIPLTMDERKSLARSCYDSLGTPYDKRGALRARTLGCGWLVRLLEDRHPALFHRLLPDVENNGMLFCNEFAGMKLREVGRFFGLSASRYNPATFLWRQIQDHQHADPVELKPRSTEGEASVLAY